MRVVLPLYGKMTQQWNNKTRYFSSVAPLKSLYFHWTAMCNSSIVFTPRSLFLLFVLLFSGLIVEDRTTAATSQIFCWFVPCLAIISCTFTRLKGHLKLLKGAERQDVFCSYSCHACLFKVNLFLLCLVKKRVSAGSYLISLWTGYRSHLKWPPKHFCLALLAKKSLTWCISRQWFL